MPAERYKQVMSGNTKRLTAEQLLASKQYGVLVHGFERTTGLRLHAYSLAAVPIQVPFDPPAFCRSLQGGLECPLYFDPQYHHASLPEVRDTCGGTGHAVIPVIDAEGRQLMNLVSEPCRLGPVDIERLSEIAFKVKVFPDQLLNQADELPLVGREKLIFAAQVLFSGVHELVSGERTPGGALELLTHAVADAEPLDIPAAIVRTALEFSGADYAYVYLRDEAGQRLASETSLHPEAPERQILQGMAEWVMAAGAPVEVADVAASAWCRHLAGGAPEPGAVVGVPLESDGRVFGGLVVGGTDTTKLDSWSVALAAMATAGADVLLMSRRLLQAGGGVLVDGPTGAYNARFLRDLLEKEISRAGRHHHDLSVVFFRPENYRELVTMLGDEKAEDLLGQIVDVLRTNTRKTNSLARVSDNEFCLVIPEAGREIAEKIALDLATAVEGETFKAEVNGGTTPVKVAMRTRTISNPKGLELLDISTAYLN